MISSAQAGVHFSIGIFAPAPYMHCAPPPCYPSYHHSEAVYCAPRPVVQGYWVVVPTTVMVTHCDGSYHYETRYTREWRNNLIQY